MSQSIAISESKFNVFQKIKAKKIELANSHIPSVINYLTDYLININGYNNFDNPDDFEDFGPVLLKAEEDKYSKKIKYGIDNPSIMNLALTGSMGSGKSTIIRTFEHQYRQYKYLNISLATFDEKTLETDKIEHNILKQLFYSVEHKKIPESRFKRIENLRGIKFKTFLFILWLCSLLFIFKVDLLDDLKETLHLNFYSGFLRILYGIYFTAYSCALLYYLMNFVLNFKLTKFKIKDVDFDNNQDKKTVNFENEIDEILYFFERSPVEIVFFQDLDRFKKSEIFIKLREINSLINNYEPIKKRRKITFIYAVCDDIFKENERAKFFDFIIPVIPVINYTSSSSKLLSKLKHDINKNKLSKDFIDDVSLFLNDYRTIKSIFNEYQIYKSILGGQLEGYDNLLAMMIYKNIEPTDFDRLNINQGYVYSVLENSKELTEATTKKYEEKTIELNAKIEQAGEEMLKDIRELRMIYIQKFVELVIAGKNTAVQGFQLQHNLVTFEEILTDDFFDQLKSQSNISYYYNHYSPQGSSISFAEIDKKVGRVNYAQRLQIISNKQNENLNRLKSELQEIEKKQKELASKKMYEVLDSENTLSYFQKYAELNKDINSYKLINYLLRGGYINEDYNHYVSYFHPGSIAGEDNEFLISQLNGQTPLPYTHKLKELNSLTKRLKSENYSRDAILNFSLIDYLIESKKTFKLSQIIDLLSRGDQKVMGFIDDYLNYSEEANRSVFFQSLAGKWHNMWIYLSHKSNYNPEKLEFYLQYIFGYLDQTSIARLNELGSLSKSMAEMENLNFLLTSEEIKKSLKEFLQKSEVKFKNLFYLDEQRDFLDVIYDNNLYEVNEKMIEFFISNFDGSGTDHKKLQTANYTTIKNSGKIKLIKYIDENLDLYIENVFLKLENNRDESQHNLCALLNNEKLTSRFEIIKHGKFSISDLSRITDAEIQGSLIIYGKISTEWKNVLSYYKKVKLIDETLIEYLNLEDIYNTLAKQGLIKDPDEKVMRNFALELIQSPISDESFDKVTANLPFSYPDAKIIGEAAESKIKSLIKYKRINLNTNNYVFIKDKFKQLLLYVVEVNASEFVKDILNYVVESSLILEILSCQAFNSEQKLLIIENLSDDVLSENTEVLLKLSDFLSENKTDKISFVLLNNIITYAASQSRKVQLANLYFSSIEDSHLQMIIDKIEGFSKLLSGKHPKVVNNLVNKELIKNLEGKLISKSKLSEDEEHIELFPYSNPRI